MSEFLGRVGAKCYGLECDLMQRSTGLIDHLT